MRSVALLREAQQTEHLFGECRSLVRCDRMGRVVKIAYRQRIPVLVEDTILHSLSSLPVGLLEHQLRDRDKRRKHLNGESSLGVESRENLYSKSKVACFFYGCFVKPCKQASL